MTIKKLKSMKIIILLVNNHLVPRLNLDLKLFD